MQRPPFLLLFLALCVSGCGLDRVKHRNCLELDHVYIFVAKGAPERAALSEAGIDVPAHVARHNGQGTASIGTIFENMYLELLWVEDEEEFRNGNAGSDNSGFVARARSKETGALPFGVGLRNRCGEAHAPPFPYREERGAWMKPGECIYVIDDASDAREPEYFVMPPGRALPAWREKVSAKHPAGMRELTSATIFVNSNARFSAVARQLGRGGVFHLKRGREPLLILQFDRHAQGRRADPRPRLPLIIEY